MGGARAAQKQSLAGVLQNRCQACSFIKKGLQYRCCQAYNFIKKGLQYWCFPMKFTKSLRTPFLTEQLYLMAASGSKQCKPIKIYTESLCCRERNDIPEQ